MFAYTCIVYTVREVKEVTSFLVAWSGQKMVLLSTLVMIKVYLLLAKNLV